MFIEYPQQVGCAGESGEPCAVSGSEPDGSQTMAQWQLVAKLPRAVLVPRRLKAVAYRYRASSSRALRVSCQLYCPGRIRGLPLESTVYEYRVLVIIVNIHQADDRA